MTTFYGRYGKRLLDLALTIPAMILLSPLLVLLALLVRWRMGAPVVFRQSRPGLYGEPFDLVKFRTMTDARDADGQLLPDVQRLTHLGRLLRASSLDELPELWNVLRGEMSLVGPRPLLMAYLPYYSEREQHRHDVRPGITGLAQVTGRNTLPWDERLELDAWYSQNLSFFVDLRVLFETLAAVLSRSGVQVVTDEHMRDLDAERQAHA